MQVPAATELLRVWEDGQSRPPWARALLLLDAAEPGARPDALARLPVGERDARLLDLREHLFGETLASLAACPHCGERLELSFPVASVRLPPPDDGPDFLHRDGGLSVRYRLPTSADFEALPAGPGAVAGLLAACISEASRDGAPVAPADLEPAEAASLTAAMAEADPRADLSAGIDCPACGHAWSAQFDILGFLWKELGAWVRRTMGEVHILASSYGWREPDVLALPEWRRRHYISLVRP